MPEPVVEMTVIDRIAIVTLNRPDRRNAVNLEVLNELARITARLETEPPRAVILTGKGGKAFSAGFDVNLDNPMTLDMFDAISGRDREKAQALVDRLRDTVDAFIALPVPVIAAVNGIAYGGGAEIAARCDMRVAGPSSVFCFSEVTLGLMPDFGGGSTLSKLIGPARAADLILTARKVRAEEALALGLVNRVCGDDEVLTTAIDLARSIAKNGPRAVRSALAVIRKSMDQTLNESLAYEKQQAVSLILSGECLHGVAAFLEKRTPDFPDPEDPSA